MLAVVERRPAVLAAAVLAASAAPLGAQSLLTEHTRTRDAAAALPAASVEEVAWLAGRWVGEGLGATVEEVWLPPAGGAMTGVFRLVRDGTLEFYEIVTVAEDKGSLVLALKHFHPDLIGWERREDVVRFPLVHRDADTWWFDGFTIRRVGPDRMNIWVALSREGEGRREARFTYRRELPEAAFAEANEALSLAPAENSASPLSDDDVSAIRSLLHGYATGWQAEDPEEAILSLFADDAVLLPHHGAPQVEGKESLRRHFWPAGLTGFRVDSYDFEVMEIAGEGGLAYSRGRYAITFSFQDGGRQRTLSNQGNYVMVFRKLAVGWKIARYIWNDPVPREG